jgi:hypothetical protein
MENILENDVVLATAINFSKIINAIRKNIPSAYFAD